MTTTTGSAATVPAPLPSQFTEPIAAKHKALEQLALGFSDFRAQRVVGVKRGTISQWRKDDPLFAHAYRAAKAEAPDHIWDAILDQAYLGNNRAGIDWLKGHGYVKAEPVGVHLSGTLEVHQLADSQLEAIIAGSGAIKVSQN